MCANLYLKCAMVAALTTSWGREFQRGMTRHEKKHLCTSASALGTKTLKVCPFVPSFGDRVNRSEDWMGERSWKIL